MFKKLKVPPSHNLSNVKRNRRLGYMFFWHMNHCVSVKEKGSRFLENLLSVILNVPMCALVMSL